MDLIGRAAIPKGNMEQIFHLGDGEVGHAPGTNPASCTETFEPRDDLGKFGVRRWPVQQIKIEMINTESGKARLARTRHGISTDVIGFHLGDDEGAVTLAGNHALNQFFGTAFTVISRCVNQRHPPTKGPYATLLLRRLPDAVPAQYSPSPDRSPGQWCRLET